MLIAGVVISVYSTLSGDILGVPRIIFASSLDNNLTSAPGSPASAKSRFAIDTLLARRFGMITSRPLGVTDGIGGNVGSSGSSVQHTSLLSSQHHTSSFLHSTTGIPTDGPVKFLSVIRRRAGGMLQAGDSCRDPRLELYFSLQRLRHGSFPHARPRAKESAHRSVLSGRAVPCFPKEVSVRTIFILAVAIPVLLSACDSGDPEAQTLGAFFSAVQKGDQAGVQLISLATFDGTVESWEIVARGTESEGPFQLAELEEELDNTRNEVRVQREQNARFIGDNRDTYDAYTRTYAEDPSAPFQGELATFHEQLQARQGLVAQLEVDAEQLSIDVRALTNAATLSVRTPVGETFEGQIKVKPLEVRINEGSENKTYTVVLHRYELTDTRLNRTPTPRWIVAEIRPGS